MTIYLDGDYNLAPIFNEGLSIPSDTSITWSIKDPSIVTVDSYGKMHAAKLGTTWVYATTYNGKSRNPCEGYCSTRRRSS